MDIGPHQLVQRTIHDLMALQRAQAGEGAGDDMHAKMSAAIPSTRMVGVTVAVVDQFDCSAGQRCCELRPDPLDAAGGVHLLSTCCAFDASQKIVANM